MIEPRYVRSHIYFRFPNINFDSNRAHVIIPAGLLGIVSECSGDGGYHIRLCIKLFHNIEKVTKKRYVAPHKRDKYFYLFYDCIIEFLSVKEMDTKPTNY